MGFYDGFQFLKKAKTRVIFKNTDSLHARIVYSCHPDFVYDIEISERAAIKEQIKSLIHESIHCGKDFVRYLGKMRTLPNHQYDKIEDEIKRQTDFIYEYHSRLVNFLRLKLSRESFYEQGQRYYDLSQ